MAEMTTLEELAASGPAAADNPDGTQQTTDPGQSQDSATSAGGSLTAEQRLARLEEAHERTTQRLQGSTEEAQRWRQQAERNEQLLGQMAQQLQHVAQQQNAATGVPQDFAQDMEALLGYAPDPNALGKIWQRFNPGSEPQRQSPAQQPGQGAYVTQDDLNQWTQRQQSQQAALRAVVASHPELGDATQWQGFLADVLPEYDKLVAEGNPLYREQADGPEVIDIGGRKLDLRLVDRAATNYKSTRDQRQEERDRPDLDANSAARRTAGPVVPSSITELLNDPSVQQALERAGWAGSKREQLEKLLKYTSDDRKQQWQQEYSQQRGR